MPATVSTEAVLDLIRTELIDSGVEEETITPEAKFDDLDIDSLDAAELMATIKRKFHITIPRAELADVTVGQLAANVAEKAGL
ncbi:acyl carrier protein [Streptomyces ureilyticus]|uniref:Acyl carrier protein n=1 Tax=Streptomyces ureilyticus TaxID=1775131 RepID=A0ABX0DW28_9ACTN|nr:phosphopantetheine-binding protein [Streptomyces ureilyticus]NGO45828.1 acyl carrier protein [Streptomyces ureilyticus]